MTNRMFTNYFLPWIFFEVATYPVVMELILSSRAKNPATGHNMNAVKIKSGETSLTSFDSSITNLTINTKIASLQ